jgi:hypothetical protein
MRIPGPDLSKHFVKLLVLTAALHGAAAEEFLHGTYFLAGISSEYAVVAIDSRESFPASVDIPANDRYCKIRALSHDVIFFASGTTSGLNASTGSIVFDARDVAQHAFEYFTGDNFDDLANKWATEMEAIYMRLSNSLPIPVINETIARGIFIGTNSHGEIVADDVTMFSRPELLTRFAFRLEHVVPGRSGNMPILNNGHYEIMDEFYDRGQTDRAKRIIAGTTGWKPGPDTDATRYSSYVAAVRDWSGDNDIGGEVATIILERGKGWRWFHRPDFCPEN